ncbi:transmembrane and coiled-coil domain-containing protein 4-like isoform X1 [Vigna unguiculata]|uniref:transmembrane and coiled-coil domain-containing protein 4-like isoform X1 n=2 Tax=Vigna unguiculata TaxID=3917 RepID=UPI0010170BEF|nr:transmembrane and coiled-coil domain-containing protein 4-like isoform X1 [Vigna unguiculata]
MMEEKTSILSPTCRHTTASLFAFALHHSQIRPTKTTSPDSQTHDPDLWFNQNSHLLCPIFRFLEVDEDSWQGIKETACSSSFRHHLGSLLTLLSEEGGESKKEAELTKAVDASALSLNDTSTTHSPSGQKTGSQDDMCDSTESSAMLFEKKKVSGTLEIATFEQSLEEATRIGYQRKVTVLYTLVAACVADTDKSRQGYDARHRVALRLLSVWLGVKWIEMEAMEAMVAFSIMNSASKEGAKEEESVGSETSQDKWKRGSIIGAAAITGGALMAVTGGLAAPAIAHGLGALAPALGSLVPAIGASGFAAAATATGSAAGSVAVAASFGAAGAGLTGSKMATRIGSLEEFELKSVGGCNEGHLAVRISISGQVFTEKDFVEPWEGLNDNMERYVLQYESKNLIALSTAVRDWLTSQVTIRLMKDGAMMTVLSSLVTALAWPTTLLATFDIIDSKWAIAVDRSDKAGKVLSEVLLTGLQGNRPVTLVGFSLGARVIFKCLQFLAHADGDHAGIVEKVVLLGAPISISDESWEKARQVVAGRFVNAYSSNDWTLGVTFRASLLSKGLAGIQPVNVHGIENVDVTHVIEGHSSYLQMTLKILEELQLDNCCAVLSTGEVNPEEKKSAM